MLLLLEPTVIYIICDQNFRKIKGRWSKNMKVNNKWKDHRLEILALAQMLAS